jgi:hypothetical protein
LAILNMDTDVALSVGVPLAGSLPVPAHGLAVALLHARVLVVG